MELNKINVLIVEDDLAVIYKIIGEFQRIECLSVSFERGVDLSEACKKVKSRRYDLVFLSLSLADSKGYKTFQKFARCSGNVPILVLGKVSQLEIMNKAVVNGAKDYLLKGEFDACKVFNALYSTIENQYNLELKSVERNFQNVLRMTESTLKEMNVPLQVMYNLVELMSMNIPAKSDIYDEIIGVYEEIDVMNKILMRVRDITKHGADNMTTIDEFVARGNKFKIMLHNSH